MMYSIIYAIVTSEDEDGVRRRRLKWHGVESAMRTLTWTQLHQYSIISSNDFII